MDAETILKRRLALGLTQADLGQRIGCDRSRISDWERGVHVPNTKYKRRLRDILQ
jgi:transcriptional regulator with XRE-family HTH domain